MTVHWQKAVHQEMEQDARWFLCEPLATMGKERKNEGSMKNKRKTKGTKVLRIEGSREMKATEKKKK